ncbi:MAG TPA: hypothetical protein V6C69_09695 [Trichormus sp.]|jgi:Skp family chaperone for outer membrane proteins
MSSIQRYKDNDEEAVYKQLISLAVSLAAAFNSAYAETEPAPIAPQVTKIIDSYRQKRSKMAADYRAKKTDQERNQVGSLIQANQEECSQELVKLAQDNPQTDEAECALLWVIANTNPSSASLVEAMDQYRTQFALTGKIARECPRLQYPQSKSAELLLRTLIKKNEAEEVRGIACLTLAKRLEESSPAQSKTLLNQIIRKYESLKPNPDNDSLGDLARAELYKVQHLSLGCTAPPLIGSDADGNKLKLSDYRGRIVMVDFFGDW